MSPAEQTAAATILAEPSWSAPAPDAPPEAVARLEEAWAALHGGGEAVAVSSGTEALTIALRALGLGLGDEVIVPAYGCVAPDMAVLEAGGVPVHADIRPEHYCLAPCDVERRISARTRAIVGVHFGGQAADFRELRELAHRSGLALIEDAALAPGAAGAAGPVGSLGDATVFSLGIDKPVHAGEGGLILTRDAPLASRCRALRAFGQIAAESDTEYDFPAGNHRMTALQAAVALPQVARLEQDRRARERTAQRILGALQPAFPFLPLALPEGNHAWSQLWLRLAPGCGVTPPRAAAAFQAEGIPLFPGWSRPNYAHRLFTPRQAATWLPARSSPRSPDFYLQTCCPAAEAAAFNEALVLPLPVLQAPPSAVDDVIRAFEKVQAAWEELRDAETRRRGDTETRRRGDAERKAG